MDLTTIGIIVVVVALIGLFLYNRSRPAPQGTYDDKKVSSSGSIGGGTRAHDDPNVRSSGSIGGGVRAYDTPNETSSGSIGGRSAEARKNRTGTNQNSQIDDDQIDDDDKVEPTKDDPNHRSRGSIGG